MYISSQQIIKISVSDIHMHVRALSEKNFVLMNCITSSGVGQSFWKSYI